jgi:hypothetical protein
MNNTATTTYTFTPTAGQCAITATMTITVNTTSTPTGTATQTFCASPAPTVADLAATGTGIQWYAAATGGTTLASITALVSGTTYYASQTLNACESTTRLTVTVTLNDPQITASATTVCSGTAVILNASTTATPYAITSTMPVNLQNGLVGYWPFNGNANDVSGNANNGTVNGATLTTDRFGSADSAYSFNGISNYITIPNIAAIGNSSRTFNAWVKLNNINNSTPSNYIISTGSPTQSSTFNFRLNNSKLSIMGFGNDIAQSTTNLNINTWYFCSVTYNGSDVKFFLNGVLLDSIIITNSYTTAGQNNYFGKSNHIGWEYYLNGKTDDISIYNRALSQSEITQLYNSNQATYLWSTGETTATINPTPTSTTTYWCDVTVNGVTCRKTMTITVNPNITPAFTQVAAICNGATLAALPTTSTNSITGTWSPALNNTATTTYTFTPTAGQCAPTATMTITVNPNSTPTFTQVAPICNGATLPTLPTTSTNSITGTWSPALNNTATTTYTFTPTTGQCASTATMTITVNPNSTPTFTQVAPICNGAMLAALQTTSNNNISGTWSPTINNAATTTYTFSPTTGVCADATTMTIVVNSLPIVNSIIGNSLVDVNSIVQLSTATIGGVWSSSSVSTASVSNNGLVLGISPGSTTITYTVTDANGCTNFSSLLVTVSNLSNINLDLSNFIYYPNPVLNELLIMSKEPLNLIEIYNLLGQSIRKINLNNELETKINFSDLSSATYIIKVSTINSSGYFNIVKK